MDFTGMTISVVVAYVSFCINPIIYASRYEVVRRYLKQMLNINTVASDNT